MNKYELYITDTETTGLDSVKNDVIELSICRLSNGDQKTWCIKPVNFETIETAALRINGHQLADITHLTKHGRETYLDPNKVIIEIENWLAQDELPASNRVLVGQNTGFDRSMLEQLWIKCNAKDSFPFGRRYLDTMQLQFAFDWCQGKMDEAYSLSNLTKKYGIKNSKAHTAAADVQATKEVFERQIELLRSGLLKE